MNSPLLCVKQLDLFYTADKKQKQLLHHLNFEIGVHEIVGFVGESGSGKSLTAQAILRLLPSSNFQSTGSILFKNENLLRMSEKNLRYIRGTHISLMSQDPSASLNPTLKIQTQLLEGLFKTQPRLSKKEAIKIGVEWLERMHIPNAALRMQQYPHELSGGTKQRIALAMALIGRPALLIADEPTTALDVTVQAEILTLFKELVKDYELSIMLITHDLGVVANCCERVMVMHAGQIVETNLVDQIFSNPQHVCTQSLLQSKYELNSLC